MIIAAVNSSCVKRSWGVIMLPIFITLAWLSFTVFLFAFGPFSYPAADYPIMYVYLFFANLSLMLGYWMATKFNLEVNNNQIRSKNILNICTFVSILWLIVTLSTWGNPQEVFQQYLDGRSDLVRAELHDSLGGRWQDFALIFISPFVYVLVTVAIFQWQSAGRFIKIVFISVIFIKLLTSIIGGGRILILETFVFTGFAFLGAYLSGKLRPSKLRIAIYLCVFLSFMVFYTSFIVISRSGFSEDEYLEKYVSLGNPERDDNNFILQLTPKALLPTVNQAIEYVSQGYYPLALCFQKPFETTYGFGQSQFLIRSMDKILGNNFFNSHSYYTRLLEEDGYSEQMFVTGYPWIANDFTFVGSLFILFLLGLLLAWSWIGILENNNIFAVPLFSFLMFMLLSLPMFSIILDAIPFVSFYSILLAWVVLELKGEYKNILK